MYEVRNEDGIALPKSDGTARKYETREEAGTAAETLTKAIGGQWRAVDVA